MSVNEAEYISVLEMESGKISESSEVVEMGE